MRLNGFKIRGLGVFREPIALDLGDLGDAKIVAVAGRNGAGKSSLLELAIPGAMYRSTPTRGSLKELATTRDACVESRLSCGGRDYRITHTQDAISGKGESSVADDETGDALLKTSKVSEFKAWSADNLTNPDVLFASLFVAQQSESFVQASSADRIAIILRAIGGEQWEARAKSASARATECSTSLRVLQGRRNDALEQRANLAGMGADSCEDDGDIMRLTEAVDEQKGEVDRLLAAAKGAAMALEKCENAVRDARASAEAHADHARRAKEAEEAVAALDGKLTDVRGRIAMCRQAIEDEPRYSEAAKEVATTEAKVKQLTEELAELRGQRSSAVQTSNAAREAGLASLSRADKLEARRAELQALLNDSEAVALATERVAELDARLEAERDALTAAQQVRASLNDKTILGKDERIGSLRLALTICSASEDVETIWETATSALEVDDSTAELESTLPQQIAKSTDDIRSILARISNIERELSGQKKLAGKAELLAHASADLHGVTESLSSERDAERKHNAACDSAIAKLIELDKKIALLADESGSCEQRVATLRPLAEKLQQVALAKSKLVERLEQESEITVELDSARRKLDAIGEPPEAASVIDEISKASLAAAAAAGARERAESASKELTRAESRLQFALDHKKLSDALKGQIDDTSQDLSDWTRLAEDCGRKGIQAAEIDAAGPEMTAMTNDLLHACFGTRWSVSVDTQRADATGKRLIEDCRLTVIDTATGREAEIKTYSGGERVVLGEAISLGLTMLSCTRSGMTDMTLVRDESGAALDPTHAPAYLAMLRRAADKIGASRVLLVSHSPEIQDCCDARVTIKDGALEIS